MFIELTKVTHVEVPYELNIDGIGQKVITSQENKIYVNVDKIQFIERSLMTDDGAYVQLDDDFGFDVKESYDVVKNMISFASRENHSL